ncbi:MAG: hypothetical protein ACREPK_06785 [Rhodanobacteraceae bacterium]
MAACSGGVPDRSSAIPPNRNPHPAVASTAATRPHSHAIAGDAGRFHVDVPSTWTVRHDFRSSYLANGAWKTFAAANSVGTPVLALAVPGSNRITDAEIRIGISRAAGEVHRCTTPPPAVRPGSISTQRINGITFASFDAGDAAMSHYLEVHGYRTVRDGTCYAIDLLVYGSNPDVYSPPATPPFTHSQAFAQMQTVLHTFHFSP